MYSIDMRHEWNPEKNEEIKKDRSISFEQIVFNLSQGDIWKTADNPDQKKYTEKKIYFVIVEDYIYMVPFVTEDEYVFLKTIIPSRKATRDYLKGGD